MTGARLFPSSLSSLVRAAVVALAAVLGLTLNSAPAQAFGSMDVTMAIISAAPTTGAAPLPVTFDGTQSYCVESCSVTAHAWDFGDGSTAGGPLVAHTYTKGGSYTARLTVTANNATTATTTVIIRVWEPTRAVISASTTVAQVPFSATFDGSDSRVGWDRTIVSYLWSFGDGGTATGPVVSHAFTTPGYRLVSLTVTDSTGYAATDAVIVYAQDALVSAINVSATSPAKGAVSLTWANRTYLLQRNWVERCAGSKCTAFTTVFGALGADTSYAEAGLTSGATYSYRIRSVDYLGRAVTSPVAKVKVR